MTPHFPGLAELVRLYGPQWGTITFQDLQHCPHNGFRGEVCRCSESTAERAYERGQAELHQAFRFERVQRRWEAKHR